MRVSRSESEHPHAQRGVADSHPTQTPAHIGIPKNRALARQSLARVSADGTDITYLIRNRLVKNPTRYRQVPVLQATTKDNRLKTLVGIIVSAMADPSAIKHVPCYIYTIASKYFYSICGMLSVGMSVFTPYSSDVSHILNITPFAFCF